MTLNEIAKRWGTAKSYVWKQVQKGCPVDSIESATAWRAAHAQRGIGYRSKTSAKTPVPKVKRRLLADHLDDPGIDSEGRNKRIVNGRRPSLTTIEASLAQAIEIEEQAAQAVKRCTDDDDRGALPVVINAYSKALSNRLETEKRVIALMVERRQLVRMDDVRAIIQRAWGPLLARLRSLPKRAAAKANPTDDALAEMVMRDEIEDAIADAQSSYTEATAP